jgi:hypothetical protein
MQLSVDNSMFGHVLGDMACAVCVATCLSNSMKKGHFEKVIVAYTVQKLLGFIQGLKRSL